MLRFLLLIIISSGILYADILFPSADFTGEGTVDLTDYAVLSASWKTAMPWFPDGLLPQKIAHWQLDRDPMDSQAAFDGVEVGNPLWLIKRNDPNEVMVGSGALGLNGSNRIEIDASCFPRFDGE